MLKFEQGIHIRIHGKNDIPAAAPIPSIWTAAIDKFFLSEMHHSVPTPAGTYVDFCFVYKHAVIITKKRRSALSDLLFMNTNLIF
jgi:hypothetical protein